MLVSMKNILVAAREGGYAVTAPNVVNEDTARAAIMAAEEHRAPMILDLDYFGETQTLFFGRMCEVMAREANVPVAINQDHGEAFEHAIAAIQASHSSIMVDRSKLPYEDNVSQVAELTRIAHAVNVSVEAELGHVGHGENYDVDGKSNLTDPTQAVDFVQRTGIDCLAIAIGTAHGAYKGIPHIDFDRLHAIFDVVSVPLVLHGGSGTGDENLAKAAREGISKVNLATDLFTAGAQAVYTQKPVGYEMNLVFREGFKEKLEHYMRLFGQCDRI